MRIRLPTALLAPHCRRANPSLIRISRDAADESVGTRPSTRCAPRVVKYDGVTLPTSMNDVVFVSGRGFPSTSSVPTEKFLYEGIASVTVAANTPGTAPIRAASSRIAASLAAGDVF